jgi:hypothetical protein
VRNVIFSVLVFHACVAHAKDDERQRWEGVAAEVKTIVSEPQNARYKVNAIDVEKPQAEWCKPEAIWVTTCGSARPKRDLYWLAVFCGEKLAYVAEYRTTQIGTVTLIAPDRKQACKKLKRGKSDR